MDQTKDLMKLDFYDILKIPPNAKLSQIKKAFRKKAISCHPDKNPDNPDAAEQFVQLKKILEILLDADKKAKYDKVLKGRKEAEIRAKNFSAKTQSLKSDLEKREKEAEEIKRKQKDDNLRADLSTLVKEENKRMFEEEINKIERQLKKDKEEASQTTQNETVFRVKAKWKKTADWKGFSKEEIQRIFYKWGEINALVMTETESRGTALIEYAEKSGAEMAAAYEKGPPGKEIDVRHITKTDEKTRNTKKSGEKSRAEERQKLIEEIQKSERNESCVNSS